MTGSLQMHIVIVDLVGSVAMIIVSYLCLRTARSISESEPENFLYGYLVWLFAALFAFSLSRSLGHIIKHLLEFTGNESYWPELSPISGSINSATFLVIASITVFFRTMMRIMNRMARDRARIKKISRELLSLNQSTEAIVSERTKTELALNVAHEIRNPVMVIGGLAHRLLRNDMDEQERKEKLRSIMEQADRLDAIVEKFENIDNELSWAFSRNDVQKLIEEAIDIITPEAEERGVKLSFSHGERRLFIEANGYLIKMAILHCLRNAIMASPPGSTIEVRAERSDVGVVIRIKDHGKGIPRETLDEIFTPLYGTTPRSKGLGLAVVKQIIEEHGGNIGIESAEGVGTEVTIFLPAQLGAVKSWKKGP